MARLYDQSLQVLKDPKPGDYFTEHFTFFVLVLKVAEKIWYIETKCKRDDKDGNPQWRNRLRVKTLPEFVETFSYVSINKGTWLALISRDKPVEGILESQWFEELVADAEEEAM